MGTTTFDTAAPDAPASSSMRGVAPRLDSVDLLRGVVMIVMALDHTRDYFSDAHFDPTDLTRTSAALFLTRWITHFCAPVFMLLAGTSACLSLGRGRSKADLSRFLVTRGLWLILLELTVIKLCWENGLFDPHSAGLMVIWALGCSMVVLAALIHLPMRALVAFGLVLACGHNLLDPLPAQAFGAFEPLWRILHVPGFLSGGDYDPSRFNVFVAYPLVPWIGVMALGFALGQLLDTDVAQRRRTLLRLGAGLIVLFVVLRAGNVYGDARAWSVQVSPLFTLFSFVDTTKYPPSLQYLAMTLGPALLALAGFEHWRGRSADFVRVFGRVPMFYYLLHIAVLSSLAVIAWRVAFGETFFVWDPPASGGWGLPVVYAVWIGVVLALYFPCRWFAALKARRRDVWLSYL